MIFLLAALITLTPPRAEVWAFCGAHPDDPKAAVIVDSLASEAGVTATFGPCMAPDWSSYSPASPGRRYVIPYTYRRLVELNAAHGLRTVVYDPRMWGTPFQQNAAMRFWEPHMASIAAFDIGDEFDPTSDEWDELQRRYEALQTLGVRPYTNHLASAAQLGLEIDHDFISFDQYDRDRGVSLATTLDPLVSTLMCAVNVLDPAFSPTPELIRSTVADLRDAGCDQWLAFGGALPYDNDEDFTPMQPFDQQSLVGPDGLATEWATALKEATDA